MPLDMQADMQSDTITLAQALIRRESITPHDANCQAFISEYLTEEGFNCEQLNCADVTNLWAVHGNVDSPPLVVFAGHTDVVPPGPLTNWQIPPFAGVVKDGMLHGRGAADMKGSVASFVMAARQFVKKYPNHNGALGLLITSDEEGDAKFGTKYVMQELDKRGVQINQCIIGEPSCVEKLGDVIKVGRRGSFGAKLIINGEQGHIAYPKNNPIHRSISVMHDLLTINWDGLHNKPRSENFPPTSFQLSNIHAGVGATNVIPGQVEIEFNLRYAPPLTEDDIRASIDQVLTTHNHSNNNFKYEINWRSSGLPFETKNGKLIKVVTECITEVVGIQPQKSTAGGTSDGRFIAPGGTEVVEFGPLNATIHQLNEQVSVADLEQLTVIYEKIIERLLG